MGATKTDHFTERQNKLATLSKAIAHPARIAIIDYLLKVDACICGEIVNELPLSQPTVSQHLKELKNAGLIKGNIEGNSICYCIDEKNWKEFQSMLNTFFNNALTCCVGLALIFFSSSAIFRKMPSTAFCVTKPVKSLFTGVTKGILL